MKADTFPLPTFLLIQQHGSQSGNFLPVKDKRFRCLFLLLFCFLELKSESVENDMAVINIFTSSCSHFCIYEVHIRNCPCSLLLFVLYQRSQCIERENGNVGKPDALPMERGCLKLEYLHILLQVPTYLWTFVIGVSQITYFYTQCLNFE